jgi:hypothetical protein
MNETTVLDLVVGVIVGFACLVVFLVVWLGPGYWAVRDAYRRGKNPGIIILLWLVFGPLSPLVWLAIRPSKTLLNRSPDEFASADDALSAATRLDRVGEWAAALQIYESVAARWPDQRDYANHCIEAIRRKEAAA